MNLLITGAWQNAKEYIPMLGKEHDVVFMQQEKDALPCDAAWVEGVICNGLFLTHPIEQFENLKYIQLTSAGFDRVPMEYVNKKGISIYNARGVYSIPMAEFALSGVLALYKRQRFFFEKQKESVWEKHRGLLELSGKTVLIVGCGSVGSECAKRFSAFGTTVLGADVTTDDKEYFEKIYAMEKLHMALAQADVVVLTLPLTKETMHLFSTDTFAAMKPGSVLVNIARGGVVDTEALVCALKEKLGGAVLDVFEEEPLGQDSPLWNMENVILTPHNSFVGEGNGRRLADVILSNIKNWKRV